MLDVPCHPNVQKQSEVKDAENRPKDILTGGPDPAGCVADVDVVPPRLLRRTNDHSTVWSEHKACCASKMTSCMIVMDWKIIYLMPGDPSRPFHDCCWWLYLAEVRADSVQHG